jgi:hypothetical protein
MVRSLALLALVTLPGLALAQSAPSGDTRTLAQAQASAPDAAKPQDEQLAASSTPPQKVRSVTVTGDKPCPKSSAGEIVVCSRANPDEKFRIPPKFREAPHPAANNSWTNRAALIDEVSREAGGLPNTCSVNGAGGQTGCSWKALQQWQAEMRAKKRAAESVP